MAAHSTFDPRGAFLGKELTLSPAAMWAVLGAGAASFLPHIILQYVGEEAVYAIVSQEMWANKAFIVTTLYGHNYGRPGLYSWLILLFAGVLGEQHILIAARLIAASSTLSIGLILAWLIRRLFNDRLFAAFGAAVFLSGDMLLYRGWLAYSDPTFSLFTFGAMACLWIATEERRPALLLFAALGLIASFLTKVPTGYLYYTVLALVLIWRHRNRGFLFSPPSLAVHLAALAFPFVWNYAIAGDSVFPETRRIILYTIQNRDAPNIAAYVALFIAYPFRVIWYLMPMSAIALYCLWSRRISAVALRQNSVLIALATVAINVLPYWLVPGSSARYLMPLYPLCALVTASIVLNSGKFMLDLSAKALIATVGVAYVAALIGFPLYEHYVRGSYDRAAQAIIARAGRFPIFVTDDTSIGLSIAADINTRRAPAPPIVGPPPQFASGFVLAEKPDARIGPIAATLVLGRDVAGKRTRYLLCRGDACAGAHAQLSF